MQLHILNTREGNQQTADIHVEAEQTFLNDLGDSRV